MKDLLFSIVNIFRYVGKIFSFIRNVFLNLLFLALVIGAVVYLIPQKTPQIPSGSILRLDISGDIVEQKRILGSFEKFALESFNPDAPEPETALQDILDIIYEGSQDDNVSILLLGLKHLGRAGLNQLQDIGRALEEFKQAGKTVVAAEDFYTQTQYYLASYADKVIVNPMGGVDIHGIGVYRLYFKDALEQLDINYNIFKVGSYKSALEPFTRNSMSSEDRLQNELWLSALWQVYTDDIMRLRNISPETLRNYTDNIDTALGKADGDPARLALQSGLVDQIWTRQQINDYLTSQTKGNTTKRNIVNSADYLESIVPSYGKSETEQPKIGLIIAEGNILPGKQPPGVIGGDTLAALIADAREDDDIKALVLRINSGGGSAFAAEVIRQELLELQKSGKPFVVSMGAVAASGGYWIAADANAIWASPSTITGSIGIFGAIPTFEKTLAKLGVYSDGTGTTPLAAGLDLTQPLPKQLKEAIQEAIIHNYDQFLQIVADGRDMTISQVEKLAQGRVYDGVTALNLGLVDSIGSLGEAIEAAANFAGITDYTTEYIEQPVSVKEQLLKFITARFSGYDEFPGRYQPAARWIRYQLHSRLDPLLLFNDPQHVYAHWLFSVSM
ncbi:MAG: signal peptide peptidase SppA [Desulforhopalus sp.]